jgi:hypothetical protein
MDDTPAPDFPVQHHDGLLKLRCALVVAPASAWPADALRCCSDYIAGCEWNNGCHPCAWWQPVRAAASRSSAAAPAAR